MAPGASDDSGDGDAEPIEIEPDSEDSLAEGVVEAVAEGSEGSAAVGENTLALGPEEGLSVIDAVVTDASVMDPKGDVALYEVEAQAHEAAGAPDDKARAARATHEIGHAQEVVLGDESAALKAYARTLALDPGLRANLWPMRRLFRRRQLWDSLLKLYDAELASAAIPDAADRADLWTERGHLLDESMGRAGDAAGSYRSALEAKPDHAPALVALLLVSCRTGDRAGRQQALEGLLARSGDPGRRAALAVELARVQRARGGEGATTAAETLRAALAAEAAASPLLDEMERLGHLADQPALLAEAASARADRLGEADGALAAALLREKARVLRAAGDHEGAFAALEQALAREPAHALALEDLMDLAERLGRPETFEALLSGDAGADPARRPALALRRAEALARAGRAREALAALADAPAGDAVVFATRARLLAQADDAAGLATLFEAEADLVAGGETPTFPSVGDRQARAAAAAHALCRAAALRELAGADRTAAEALLRRALALYPGYRPATEALAGVLGAAGRHEELAALLASELTGAAPERREHLLESLVALHRDALGDAAAALRYQEMIADERPGDVRAMVRLADLQAVAGLPADHADTLVNLAEHAGSSAAEAALKIIAARRLRLVDRAEVRARARALLGEALTLAPGSLAAAEIEAIGEPDGEGRDARIEALAVELHAAEERGATDVAGALRWRIAAVEVEAGRAAQAIETLAPLRSAGDGLAMAFSLAAARKAGDASLELQVLPEVQDGVPGRGERMLARAEALEATGDAPGAAEAFRQAVAAGAGLDASLGAVRVAVRSGEPASVVGSLADLAEAMAAHAPDAAAVLAREAALYAASAAVAGPQTPAPLGQPDDAVLTWFRGLRERDGKRVSSALGAMADAFAGALSANEIAALRLREAMRGRTAGEDSAVSWQALMADGDPGIARAALVGATDAGDVAAGLRARRAETAPPSLAAALWMEEGTDLEARGRLREAGAAFRQALDLAPGAALPVLESLRRLRRAADDRPGEAKVLSLMGALMRNPARAAQVFAEAALLYEEAGRPAEAAPLYGKVLTRAPDDQEAYQRLYRILSEDRSETGPRGLERLLTHKLRRLLEAPVKIAFYAERAELRLERLGDRRGAAQDFKRILNIDPEHLDALHKLATLAREGRRPARAAELIERYLEALRDDHLRAPAQLELAAAHQAAGEPTRAMAVLRMAVEAHPDDAEAIGRLADLAMAERDWPRAIEALHALERTRTTPREQAAVLLRLGRLLRDHAGAASEAGGSLSAVAALERAVELDPLGDGVRDLVALHDRAGDERARAHVIDRAVAAARAALADDPVDVAGLERLRELLELGGDAAAAAVPTQVLTLLGLASETGKPRDLTRPPGPDVFRERLAHPGMRGLAVDIWPLLVEAAQKLYPVDAGEAGATRATRVTVEAEPRLAWVDAAARALGLPKLQLHLAAATDAVTPLELPDPALVLGRAILAGDATARFRVGRALALLRERATVVDARSPDDLAALFAAAAVTAGAGAPAGIPAAAVEAQVKALGRALGRKARKALLVYAGRFGAEPIDVAAWRAGVLATADRVGLLLAGDVVSAARAAGAPPFVEGEMSLDEMPARLRDVPAVVDLLVFALSNDYLEVRREAGVSI